MELGGGNIRIDIQPEGRLVKSKLICIRTPSYGNVKTRNRDVPWLFVFFSKVA